MSDTVEVILRELACQRQQLRMCIEILNDMLVMVSQSAANIPVGDRPEDASQGGLN